MPSYPNFGCYVPKDMLLSQHRRYSTDLTITNVSKELRLPVPESSDSQIYLIYLLQPMLHGAKPLITYLLRCLQISENNETFEVSLTSALGGSSVDLSINSPRLNASASRALITVTANDAPVRFSQVA